MPYGDLAAADEIFWGLATEARLFGAERQPGVERVHYLGVGVGVYADRSYNTLPNASRDPVDLAAALAETTRMGERIVLRDNEATRAGLEAAIGRLAMAAGPNDLVVFHFSGHGVGLVGHRTGERRGLLLLHDAPPFEELARGESTVGVTTLEEVNTLLVAAGLRAKQLWFLLDACYGGLAALPVRPGSKAVDPEMARFLSSQPGALLMTAGGAGQVVLDGREAGHGLLTGWWIQALKKAVADPEDWAVELEGRRFLAVEQAYPRFRNEIFATARDILVDAHSRPARTPAPGTEANPQIPRMTAWSGETLILLPLKGDGPGKDGKQITDADVVAKSLNADSTRLQGLLRAVRQTTEARADPARWSVNLLWVPPDADESAQLRSAPLRPFRIGEDWRFVVELMQATTGMAAYDLLLIDDRGLVQWLAPANETWEARFSSAGPMAFGTDDLPEGELVRLPPVTVSPGFSQAGETGRRMWLFLVLHHGNPKNAWREALAEASSLSAARFAEALTTGAVLPTDNRLAGQLEQLRRMGWKSVRLLPGWDGLQVETTAKASIIGWSWEVSPSGETTPRRLWESQ